MYEIRSRVANGIVAFALSLAVGISGSASAETATLTLDGLSFISFEDEITISIPTGGTIQFHFGTPNPDGTVPFQIGPVDVNLPPVSSETLNATLQYGLASQASGIMTPTTTGRRISFNGVITARDLSLGESSARTYALSFTTEHVSAQSLDGSAVVARDGFRAPEGADYVQLVGATVAKSENEHGSAVYMVLSGTFDRLP